MSAVPAVTPHVDRIPLRTDQARLTTGRFAAMQIDLGDRVRAFVVATHEEAERGSIPRDRRPVYLGLHEAFDAAHLAAIQERAMANAA